MKYNYSKEKAKEVLKKYAEGGKVNAGTYRVGNPIKVGNMYEQKVAIISSNGDIRSNSEFGMTKTDFISMKYPKISEKKFYSLSNYAEGGSLGNHGLKHGDQIIKTMSGGVQKIKTKTGDIVYVNLANGYRGAEPPLPFETGGGVGESKFEIKFNKDDKNEGEIITPYKYKIIGYSDSFELKVRFEELYKGTYSFNEYNICQFIIESRDINSAIKLAIERLKYIFKDGVAKRNSNKIFVVSGFQFDEKNTKKPYTPSFMENTHSMNQFTENSFKTKKGDLLKYPFTSLVVPR
jgi:hypothetical protein